MALILPSSSQKAVASWNITSIIYFDCLTFSVRDGSEVSTSSLLTSRRSRVRRAVSSERRLIFGESWMSRTTFHTLSGFQLSWGALYWLIRTKFELDMMMGVRESMKTLKVQLCAGCGSEVQFWSYVRLNHIEHWTLYSLDLKYPSVIQVWKMSKIKFTISLSIRLTPLLLTLRGFPDATVCKQLFEKSR